MKEHEHDPQVSTLVIETLRVFLESNATFRDFAIEAGAVNFSLQALTLHGPLLLNTRTNWDSQNVYGDLNDAQYNVPGAAAEMLSTLSLSGPRAHREMLALGAIATIKTGIEVTRPRIATVRERTHRGGCIALWRLRLEAEMQGRLAELEAAQRSCNCPMQD